MPILEFKMDFSGQSNVDPRLGRMVSDDILSVVTSVNYIKSAAESQGIGLLSTDFIAVSYNGGLGWFNPTIDGLGNITLAATDAPGGVTVVGSVTAGNVATFAGSASIQDGGTLGSAAFKSASDGAKLIVSAVNGATTLNHIAKFADSAGTIQDGGVLGTAAAKAVSDNTKASVSSINGATVIGNVASFSDILGTVQDSGVAVSSLQPSTNIKADVYNYGGGSATFTIPVSGLVQNVSPGFVQPSLLANPSVINIANTNASGITVVMDADPGVSRFSWMAFVSPQ